MSLWCMTGAGCDPSHVRQSAQALQSYMGVTFAYGGKVMGSNFTEPPDGGVFGSEALRRVWYVTELANLLRILSPCWGASSDSAT
eukprot:407871-Prymnesium_polylepis.1